MTTVRSRAGRLRAPLARVALFLVHSNLLISLSATGVALSTVLLAGLPIERVPLFLVFAVTFFVYSFNRLSDLAEDRQNVPGRASFIDEYGRLLLAVGIVLYGVATAVAVLGGVPGAPAMLIPLAVAVLYSTIGLKRVLLVKNLLVGLSWGLIPLGVGVYYGALLTVDILFLAGFITAALTIAAVVFDIKDIDGDRAEGISTVPVLFGPARTRRVAIGATILLGAAVSVGLGAGVLHWQYVALLPFLGYMIGYSAVARRDRTPLFYGFIVDGEHLLLSGLLISFELIG